MSTAGSISELSAAWRVYVDMVPLEERQAVARMIASKDLTSPTGYTDLMMTLLAALLEGTLSPVTVNAALPILDRIVAHIHAMNARQGAPGQTGLDLAALLADLLNRSHVVPHYTASPRIAARTGEDVVEGSPIPARKTA